MAKKKSKKKKEKKGGLSIPKGSKEAKGVDVGTKPIDDAKKAGEAGGFPRVKTKDMASGDIIELSFLMDDITNFRSAWRHNYVENEDGDLGGFTCLSKIEDYCCLCDIDHKASRTTMMPAWNHETNRLEVLEKGVMISSQLSAYFEKYGGTLLGRTYDLKRDGVGKNNTKWHIMPNDLEDLDPEIVEVIQAGIEDLYKKIDIALAPKTNEEIEAWLGGDSEKYDKKDSKEEKKDEKDSDEEECFGEYDKGDADCDGCESESKCKKKTKKSEKKEEVETEEMPDCFGDYDKKDKECKDCDDAKACEGSDKEKENEEPDIDCKCGNDEDFSVEEGKDGDTYICDKCGSLFDSDGELLEDKYKEKKGKKKSKKESKKKGGKKKEKKKEEINEENYLECPECDKPVKETDLECPHCGVGFEDM